MFRTLAVLLLLVAPAAVAAPFDFDATLRIDLNHSGRAGEDVYALDRLHREGEWPGPRADLTDDLGLGRSLAELRDPQTGAVLWSRGFDTYCGEWKTTAPAAAGVWRTYHESVRTPFPAQPVTLVLQVRGDDGTYAEVYRLDIDPADVEIRRDPQDADLQVVEAHVGGAPSHVVDVVILGDGYTAQDAAKFEADVHRFAEALLSVEPFASMKDRFSIRGVLKPSQERGCDEPTRGVHRNTALGCTFNSLGSTRYMLTEDNRAIRNAARAAPYDVLSVMVNHERYGGGGIYNLFNTFTSDNQWSEYVFVHEFGHGFAGLADEYYSSSTSYTDFYPAGYEPAERNITRDPQARGKWGDLVTGPAPTPWNKAEYDAMDAVYMEKRAETNARIAALMTGGAAQAEIDRAIADGEELSRSHQAMLDGWFARQPQHGTVGVYEGAGYCSEGVYRAELDCIMFTKGLKGFCAACGRGIGEVVKDATD